VTALFLIFAVVTAPFLIFGAVTAFFFSCSVPTLFGASAVAAAYVVPLSAMNSASSAIVLARREAHEPSGHLTVLSILVVP
jgi:hypothetical protein